MLRRRIAVAAAGITAVGAMVALPAVGTADAPVYKKTTTVNVVDDFYSPTSLSIKQNDQVNFKWDAGNTNTHNVVLQKGPKGVKLGCKTKGKDAYSPLISKCNKSGSGAIGIKFKKKFDKAGTYDFVCTIHPTQMQLEVKVAKKKK
ncbi:MAG: plastocyanin/azurin family copper-binding protein [Solirubrobacterales bacterium]